MCNDQEDHTVNEIAYRPPAMQADYGLGQPVAASPPAVPVAEDTVQRIVAEVSRDLQQQIEWQVQRQIATRRGPSLTEAVMILGSLATGTIITGLLVANATTVVSGIFGTQTATHLNTLPLIVVVWLALIGINLVWARRR
jgi:hypothetical protein